MHGCHRFVAAIIIFKFMSWWYGYTNSEVYKKSVHFLKHAYGLNFVSGNGFDKPWESVPWLKKHAWTLLFL